MSLRSAFAAAAGRIGRGTIRTMEVTYATVRFFAMLGFLAAIGIAGFVAWQNRPTLPERFSLHIVLPGSLSESASLGRLFGGPPSLRVLLDTLYAAADDPRVTSIIAELGTGPFSLSQNQEIATALQAVRDAGKPTLAWTDSFGELSPGLAAYHLASAFEQVWLQPAGMLGLTGPAAAMPHYGQALEEFGVDVLIQHREEFKTVQHHLLYGAATEPEIEMTESILADLASTVAEDIARHRGIPRAEARAFLDHGPFTDREAEANGLVDRLAWRDEALDTAGSERVDLYTYRQGGLPAAAEENATQVSFVTVQGPIQRGHQHGADFLAASPAVGGARIARVIDEAARREEIKAIILRIDSPGGSPAASETIRRAVARAKAEGKPVIVSMASVAGSGGYWIATDAAHIVAEPTTLTGSIGVAGGKISIAPLLERHGIAVTHIESGPTAGMWSMTRGYHTAEHAKVSHLLDATYDAFISRVSDGRNLSPATVHDLAKGRVWTGRQALERGLVDELGGLEAAKAATRRLLDLDEAAALRLVEPLSNNDPTTLALNWLKQFTGSVATALADSLRSFLAPPEIATMPPLRLDG